MSHTELVTPHCIATPSRSPCFSEGTQRTEQPKHACSHGPFNAQDNVWSFGYIQIIYKLLHRVTLVGTKFTYNLNAFLSTYFDFLMCWIDITLSPKPHNTSWAFTVQPQFSGVHQLLVGSSEFQGRPDQILLNSCLIIVIYRDRERDRNIRYDYMLL